MSKKTVTVLAALVAAGLSLTGCGGAPSDSAPGPASGTLRVNWGPLPESWAPGSGISPGEARIPYETLLTVEQDGTVAPNLVTDWELTSTDLTLTLRENVLFHDGTPFDAEAVKANIEYVRDSPGRYSGSLKVIQSIDVVDDHTVKLNLRNPAPSLPATLGYRNVMIASPAALADGSVVSHPVGTGPWKYDEASSIEGTKMSFTLFDDYWGDEPGFANVEMYAIADETAASAALIAGELDLTTTAKTQQPRLEAASNVATFQYPAINSNLVFFDRAPGGVFASADLRKAICYSLDLQVVADVDDGQWSRQHFLEGEYGYNPDIKGYAHDPAAAKKHLAAAGNPTLSVEMPGAVYIAQRMAIFSEQISALDGVTATWQELPTSQFPSQWNSGTYPLGQGNSAQFTPYDWYVTWFAADAGGNPAHYESPALKAAATAAIAAGDSEEAEALWQKVMKIIIDDEALACAFMTTDQYLAYNTDTVAGVAAPPTPWEQSNVNYRDLTPVS